jgi:hypothetical protein
LLLSGHVGRGRLRWSDERQGVERLIPDSFTHVVADAFEQCSSKLGLRHIDAVGLRGPQLYLNRHGQRAEQQCRKAQGQDDLEQRVTGTRNHGSTERGTRNAERKDVGARANKRGEERRLERSTVRRMRIRSTLRAPRSALAAFPLLVQLAFDVHRDVP